MQLMSVESLKELDDFFRSMRQAFNSRDLKTFRSHFWTDKRFQNLDASGRRDRGWGEFEEVLDQEFRYLESVKLELKDLDFQIFDDQFATVVGGWKLSQVDPEGRNHDQNGRCTFALCRMSDDWKIVAQHYSQLSEESAPTE
jgi:ketosteroid isomerase-like protein